MKNYYYFVVDNLSDYDNLFYYWKDVPDYQKLVDYNFDFADVNYLVVVESDSIH